MSDPTPTTANPLRWLVRHATLCASIRQLKSRKMKHNAPLPHTLLRCLLSIVLTTLPGISLAESQPQGPGPWMLIFPIITVVVVLVLIRVTRKR